MPKTIFHTTEKSNFILNMKTEEYYRFNLRILQLFLILMPVFSIVLEFAKVYSVPGMALSITGVLAMVFVFIGYMKLVTPKQLLLPAILLGGMVAWGGVSLYNCYFRTIGLLGSDGRSEGLLSILFYGCFFLLGAQLGTDDNRRKLLNGMLWMGLAECAWSLLQIIPIGFPSYYKNLEPLLLFRVFLPAGLTGNPIFLAALLVMLTFPAILGAVFAEEKKQRRFYIIAYAAFVMVSVRTQCIIGLCGTALSIVAAMLTISAKKGGKKALLTGGIALIAFAAGFAWSWFGPAINGTYSRATGEAVMVEAGYMLYDGAEIWEDSSYRLATSGYYVLSGSNNPNGHFDISSVKESYTYLWKSTLGIIRRFPLAGSGPDNLIYPQMYRALVIPQNPNTFDRAFNWYLHTAATLGIPMLVLLVALMGVTVKRGAGHASKGGWLDWGIFGAVALYLLCMLFGSSSITVAPLFWMLAGCCCRAKE